jgi:hypothetical protein
MLVIMLFMLVATAAAGVSVLSTQAELQAAGEERLIRQARAGAEASLTTAISWVDSQGSNFDTVRQEDQARGAPLMAQYGKPPTTLAPSRPAWRSRAIAEDGIRNLTGAGTTATWPPLANANPATDPIGSFGPGQAYGLPVNTTTTTPLDAYVVDFTDCADAPSSSLVGYAVTGPLRPTRWICTLTSRFAMRLVNDTKAVAWPFGTDTYNQFTYGSLVEARATIITPVVLVPRGSLPRVRLRSAHETTHRQYRGVVRVCALGQPSGGTERPSRHSTVLRPRRRHVALDGAAAK